MHPIKPCLWFKNQAEEAAQFYTSVFKNSKITSITYYGKNMHMPEGTVLTVNFEINGQPFMALNGSEEFPFTQATSMVISCDTQEELDDYWEKLLAGGGEEVQCGWLKDKYGYSWQLAPTVLEELMTESPEKCQRVMDAVMTMIKLDIETMKNA